MPWPFALLWSMSLEFVPFHYCFLVENHQRCAKLWSVLVSNFSKAPQQARKRNTNTAFSRSLYFWEAALSSWATCPKSPYSFISNEAWYWVFVAAFFGLDVCFLFNSLRVFVCRNGPRNLMHIFHFLPFWILDCRTLDWEGWSYSSNKKYVQNRYSILRWINRINNIFTCFGGDVFCLSYFLVGHMILLLRGMLFS